MANNNTDKAEGAAMVSEGGNKNSKDLLFPDNTLYEFEGVPSHRFINPEHHLNKIKNLELEKDDVMVCGYPKSGN